MKKLSLKLKLYVLVLGLVLLMGLAMVIAAQSSLSSMEKNITQGTSELVQDIVVQRLEATAGQYGEQVSGMLNEAFKVPQTFLNVIEQNVEATSSERMSRGAMSQAVGALLRGQPEISATYAHFEPDAYDGQDRYFTGGVEEHSSDPGTLEIAYYRAPNGDVLFTRTADPAEKYDSSLDEFGGREAEWYLCSRDTLKPCTLEPYEYQVEEGYNELMTSLVMPILTDGEFAGVLGIDVNLSTIQQTVVNVSKQLYDGASRVTLISEKGLIAGSSHYQNSLARPLSEARPNRADAYMSLHKTGEVFESRGGSERDGEIAVSFPIQIKESGTTWALLIELPRSVALASVQEMTNMLSQEISATAQRQLMVGIVVSLLALGLLVWLVRSITHPLDLIQDRMANLASADGDLTHELSIDTHAELITLTDSFNAFLAKLRAMVNDLKDINQAVGVQVVGVQSIATETDENTGRQYSEIDSVVTAMNEMSAAASEVATFASDAANNAKEASNGVTSTQTTLSIAVDGVQALARDMEGASEAIGHVANRSDDINRILDVIRGVAEQTNLLALNAAIEAARAGEHGRGFAVVADEVRTLASRTRESTDEISQLIEGLQRDVQQTVSVIGNGVDRATSAVEQTREADQALADVVDRIATIVEHVTQVATAAEEQSSVSEEINRNLTNIGDAANDLRELAQRVRDSGESLGEQMKAQEAQLGRLRT